MFTDDNQNRTSLKNVLDAFENDCLMKGYLLKLIFSIECCLCKWTDHLKLIFEKDEKQNS